MEISHKMQLQCFEFGQIHWPVFSISSLWDTINHNSLFSLCGLVKIVRDQHHKRWKHQLETSSSGVSTHCSSTKNTKRQLNCITATWGATLDTCAVTVTPHPCQVPSQPPSGPGQLQMFRYLHSPPEIILRARPQCRGWCSSHSRPESRCLLGSAETKHPHLQRTQRSKRRRSWRRVRRTLQGSSDRSLARPRLSCSCCCRRLLEISGGPAASWPCSSWSLWSLPQSQNAPCLVLGSHLHPFCICGENKIFLVQIKHFMHCSKLLGVNLIKQWVLTLFLHHHIHIYTVYLCCLWQ